MRYLVHHTLRRLRQPFAQRARRKRMQQFLTRMDIRGGERVIDLGGVPEFWDDCPLPLDITIVNIPGFNPPEPPPSHHTITLLIGDATDMAEMADQSFDLAFSNSVIEHVGDPSKQQAMAQEVQRLAPAYWVQTPSIWFPIEAHTMMPFWWFYPPVLKAWLMRRWRKKLPNWSVMIETTTVLLRSTMCRFFPDGTVWTERVAGIPKSYILYKPKASSD